MIESRDLPPLSEGWVWTRLGEVCLDPQYGWTTSAIGEGTLRLLRTTDITSGHIDWSSVPFCKKEPPEKEKYLLNEGDIVISRAGSIGHSNLIKDPKEAIFASYLIRFKPLVEEHYLAFFLKSPFYWEAISEKSLGIAVPNVNATKLKQIFVPLPPLPEQHRIVAKIEELFTKLDAGLVELKKVKAQLKRYRQAVLKYAFEGKLTEEWREAHKDELELASVLLERIKEERKKNAKGKYKELPTVDTSELPELPEGWVWSSLEYYCKKITDGSHYTPKYAPDGYPFITISNVDGEIIDFSSAKLIGEDDFNALKTNCNPHCGDILFSKDGTVGKVIEVNFEKEFIVLSSLAIIRPFTDFTYSHYLKFLLQSRMVLNQATKLKTGTALTRIILRNLKTVKIPIPHILEQHKIVEEIECRFSVADNVEQAVDQSLKQAERLRQSILKRAFEGKLAPQDTTDEPASMLLERIKGEKAKREAEQKTNKRRKRKRDLVQKQTRFNDYV